MNNTIEELQGYFCPYWWADMEAVCKIGHALELNERELFEIIDEWKGELCAANFDDIDPVAAIMEHALQMARNDIEKITGYDFLNDTEHGQLEIYTYWNYVGSSYDYSEVAKTELTEKVAKHHEAISQSIWCRYLLAELGITLNTERE